MAVPDGHSSATLSLCALESRAPRDGRELFRGSCGEFRVQSPADRSGRRRGCACAARRRPRRAFIGRAPRNPQATTVSPAPEARMLHWVNCTAHCLAPEFACRMVLPSLPTTAVTSSAPAVAPATCGPMRVLASQGSRKPRKHSTHEATCGSHRDHGQDPNGETPDNQKRHQCCPPEPLQDRPPQPLTRRPPAASRRLRGTRPADSARPGRRVAGRKRFQ